MTGTNVIDLQAHGIHVELGGLVFGKIAIPYDYVPYTFAPILGQHKLIHGGLLQNGMIVVVEDNMFRRNPDVLSPDYPDRKNGFVPSSYDRAAIEEQSRWALVTDLQNDGNLISFTAIYSDGTMRSRQYNKSIKWAVLEQFDMLPVCPECGKAHPTASAAPSFAEDFLKGLDEALEAFFPGILDQIQKLEDEENAYEDSPRPDETLEEFADRKRDEAEASGEYNRDEKPKLTIQDRLREHLANGGER